MTLLKVYKAKSHHSIPDEKVQWAGKPHTSLILKKTTMSISCLCSFNQCD